MKILCQPGLGYPVYVGDKGVNEQINRLIGKRSALLVTDENVARSQRNVLRDQLSGFRLETLVLPPGEEQKKLEGWSRILDALVNGHFHRDAVLIAFGGGVIGDLAGFAAACYQRGIDWIAAPTTLLAQVDAAIGGKTAVNHPAGKNLIGAFHDPIAVWIDPTWLQTLPQREYLSGFGEVIKYGLGFDAELFAWLEAHASALAQRDRDFLAAMIPRAVAIKLAVVARDRTEKGPRALLNLGHTWGHAIETTLGYGTWLHGEAVASGLVTAVRLSIARERVPARLLERLLRVLQRLGLPSTWPDTIQVEDLRTALGLDKKILNDQLRFIGLGACGRAEIWDDVSRAEVDALLERGYSPPSSGT